MKQRFWKTILQNWAHHCNSTILLILLIITLNALSAQTNLSGDITVKEFTREGNPYIVNSDITIQEKSEAVIGEGCIFLFMPFTRLIVSGNLTVKGTYEHPVIFTSIKDTTVNELRDSLPALFDWDGIYIRPCARSVSMKYFQLRYSVFGIKSQTKNISIRRGTFNSNGQFHFSINEKLMLVQDRIPFTYRPETITGFSSPVHDSIQISSVPSSAEVYINKKPAKRIHPNSFTPTFLSSTCDSVITVTLFKKGYSDTTLNIDFSKIPNDISVPLSIISPEQRQRQTEFIRDRLHARIGIGCFLAAPFFIASGIVFSCGAVGHCREADKAAYYLNNTIASASTLHYQNQLRQYKTSKKKTDIRRKGAISAFCTGAAIVVSGVTLYWYW